MLLGINLCPPLVIDMMHHANCQTEVVHSLTAAAPGAMYLLHASIKPLARIIRIFFFIKVVGWYYPGVAYLNWLGMGYIL